MRPDRLAERLDRSGLRPHETEDRADEHRLAGSRRADDGKDLPAMHIDVEVFQHGRAAESDGQSTHLDDRTGAVDRHQKSMAP